MKRANVLFGLIVPFLLVGCSEEPQTTISYSGEFELEVPASLFSGAVIFASNELSFQTADERLISGMAVTRDAESLPADFPMSDYPEYILGMKETGPLPAPIAEQFKSSSREIEYSYGLEDIQVNSFGKFKAYVSCRDKSCLAYVVIKGVDDHLLSLHAQGVTYEGFNKLLKGLSNAEAK